MAKEKMFHFGCGDSNDGPVGFCANIRGTDKDEALIRLREMLPESVDATPQDAKPGEYLMLYLNGDNVKVKDMDFIEHEPDAKEDEDDGEEEDDEEDG